MDAQQTMDLTCSLSGGAFQSTRESGVRASLTWARWLVPDVALLVSCLTLFFCLFLFDGTHSLFRDSDTGWHIRTGESILSGAGLPRTDSYSLLKNGQPWFAWEWASDVLMGAAHRVDGLSGVVLLYGVAIAACTWLWFRVNWIAGGNFLLACGMAALMISTANLHWLARPHVFSWLFLLAAIWAAEKAPERFTPAHGIAIALASALWANLHASFFVGPVIALIYAISHFARPLIWTLNRSAEWRRARWFLLAAACAAFGTLLNPYGFQLHSHVLRYLSNSELIDRIGEFQSFNFHVAGSFQILLAVGFAMLGGVLALGQRKLHHFLLAALFVGLALRSARGLPLVALLILPLANGAITEALAAASGLATKLRSAIDAFLVYNANLRRIDAGFNGVALIPLILLLVFACLHVKGVYASTGFPADQFPVAAAAQLDKLPADIRLLSPDKFGGYLIYRFNGTRRVYFDGRSDFYGSAYMKDYLRLVEVRPGWRQILNGARFTHALLPNQYSLIPALEQSGWKTIYSDSVATLLEKN
jgi:hypothetical protein